MKQIATISSSPDAISARQQLVGLISIEIQGQRVSQGERQ
jgi:hypothetical protein